MPGYTRQRADWKAWPDTSTKIREADLDAWENAIYDMRRLQLDVREFGTVGTANDFAVFQATIDEQQVSTDTLEIVVPPGTFNIDSILVASPNLGNATRPLYIRGAGMHNTVLQCGFHPTFGGLFGYGRSGTNPNLAQVVMSDLTIDGNYSGVAGGALAATAGDSLISLVHPYTSAAAPVSAPTGLYHYFERVRFYRPTCYAFQPSKGIYLSACLFDACGQPDLSPGSTHYDNLGSDWGDAIVLGCTWRNSSGNYVDFQAGSDASRIVFMHNDSLNHQIGGLFGAGVESVIAFNHLVTANASGIGYDAGTSNKSKNLVAFNNCPNMNVLGSGLSSSFGDRVYGNLALDQPQGAASITVTASPFTYTAGPTQEAVYIRGGTVSSIAKNSVTLFTQTEQTVWLEPGEAVVVTYSSAPTMVKDRK